ncbi:MAG: glycosyltransferase [Lachnospiraceae bacterium]|nr:glycosyltransferase [Lachnospiraceae bacterium]
MLNREFKSYSFFPGQHWDHTWERQHEIVTRLSKEIGSQVEVCRPLGFINHNPFSIKFIKRIVNYRKHIGNESIKNPLEPNINLIGGSYIPWHNSTIGKINFRLLNAQIEISDNNFFWSTYINPTIYEFFKRSRFKVYDIAERRSKNNLVPQKIKELERKVVAESDVVFIDNQATINDYKDLNQNIYYIPQGVNTDTFFPNDDCPKEYIGYIGNLHFAIDYDFFEQLIQINQNQKFLIIGAIIEKKAFSLLKYPNVTYVPQVAKNELNSYLSKMKVGLIPYLINDVTVGVYPTKLFEYISSGVPVISTNLPEVAQYANNDYLKIINNPELINVDFSFKNTETILKENTWDMRWNEYLKRINQCLK